MTIQGCKLKATLATVVNGLDTLEAVLLAVSVPAKHDVAYGVERRHYAVVGETLLWTLERGLGSRWTGDLAAASAAAYGALCAFVINEAYGRTEAAE